MHIFIYNFKLCSFLSCQVHVRRYKNVNNFKTNNGLWLKLIFMWLILMLKDKIDIWNNYIHVYKYSKQSNVSGLLFKKDPDISRLRLSVRFIAKLANICLVYSPV